MHWVITAKAMIFGRLAGRGDHVGRDVNDVDLVENAGQSALDMWISESLNLKAMCTAASAGNAPASAKLTETRSSADSRPFG